MSEVKNIDDVRGATLDHIERSERNYKLIFAGAAVVEGLFLAGFLVLADFSNRTHLLLLIAAIAVYTIMALGLVALGSYMNRNTLRILKAIELLGSQLTDERR